MDRKTRRENNTLGYSHSLDNEQMNGWVCVGQHSRSVKHFLSMCLLTQSNCSVTRAGVTMLRERGGVTRAHISVNDSIIRQQDLIGYHGSSFTAVKKKEKTLRGLFWAWSATAATGGPPRALQDDVMWWVVCKEAFPPLRTVRTAFVTMASMEFFTLLSSLHLCFSSVAAFMMSNTSNLWVWYVWVSVIPPGSFKSGSLGWRICAKIREQGSKKTKSWPGFRLCSLWADTIVPSQVALSARQIF